MQKINKQRLNFWWVDKKCPSYLQESYFVKLFSADNFQHKKVIRNQQNLSKSVSWSKYNTVSPEKYYFLGTIK